MIIEHNLDIIKVADHIIDLGPEGGDGGGEIVAEGTPEDSRFYGEFLYGRIPASSAKNQGSSIIGALWS